MGGTVSTGEDNDDLVDNLVKRDCITSGRVEHVFRAVDRGHYFTEECRDSAYKDTAWRSDNLHLSAPCIYSSVMENLSLKPGHSFLNIGSGTGYVSTMAGLIVESSGVNHGVELFQDVIDYANERLADFTTTSSAVDQFDFCPPQFVCGNGLLIASGRQYDRVYCGARCPLSEMGYLKQLLKIGGVLVVPVNDHLKRIERVGETEWRVEDKLSVSFASLIEPNVSGHKTELTMPPLVPASLQQLCRTHIRRVLRTCLLAAQPPPPPTARAQRRRRPVGRRAEQARRIQRFVMPLLGAAVAEVNDSDQDPEDAYDEEREREGEEDQEEERAGRRRSRSGDGEERQREREGEDRPREREGDERPREREREREGRGEEERDSDHSEEAYMELAGTPAAEQSPRQEQQPQDQEQQDQEQPKEQQDKQESRPADPQQEEEAPVDGSPPPEAAQTRASLKRSSEESGAGGEGEPAAGAGPSDSQKRGRRDKFDSGLGDSPPPPPALPPRDHSEPENGVAASSDEEEDDDDDDDDEGGVGRGRRLMLLPPPSRWGGRSGRFRTEFATELSRFLAAGSDEDEDLDDELELDDGERRPRCLFDSRRRARPTRHAAGDAGKRLADQLRAQIASLPLPPPLRQYVNLGRPL